MKKFLSLILALTLVVSLFTVSVMAAPTNHVVTITADKTTALKAGDVVTVELTIDNNANFTACGYELLYDTDAFEIDTEKGQKIGLAKYENFIDINWYKGITNTDESAWALLIAPKPEYNYSVEDGSIKFVWSGTEGISSTGEYKDYIESNYLVGKFKFTVKADAVDGNYDFALVDNIDKCYTLDIGENTKGKITATPATVTVGEEKKDPAIDEVRGAENTGIAVKEEVGNFKYDNAYAVEVDLTADVKGDVVGVEFVPAFMSGSIDDIWKFAAETTTYSSTWLGEGGATLKAALINIPIELLNETFTIKARAFVKNGADKTYFGTIVEQEVTYTVD